MVQARCLGPHEIERIREAGGPLAAVADLSQLASAEALPVIEVDGRVVAYWPLFYALHLEPLWIAEGHRRNPAVARALLELVDTEVRRIGEPCGFAIMDESSGSIPLGERLGFARVPGDLYYVMLPAAEPVGG